MTDIPFLVLIFVLGFITVILSMGYIFRTKFPISMLLFFSGAIFLLLFITTDNIEALGLDTTETPNYNITYPMDLSIGTTGLGFSSTVHGITERPNTVNSVLYNQKISCILPDMDKEGSPTGTATIGIFDNDNMLVKQFGTIAASTVNVNQKTYTFCLPNHDYYVITLYDRVGVKYTTGTGTDTIRLFVDTTGSFDGTDTIRSSYISGTWTDVTTSDIRMKLISEDLTVSNNQELYAIRDSVTFEPTFIGISMILMSLCLIVMGGLVETGKFN